MSPFGDHPLAGPPFCIIQAGKQKSVDLAQAVLDGYGGGVIHYGGIKVADIRAEYTPVFIGPHPTTIDTLHELKFERRPFITIDNGYFKPYKEGGYFRATSNALQWVQTRLHSGVGRYASADAVGRQRYEALGLPELKPWRRYDNGGPILIVLQSPLWLAMMREYPTWLDAIVQRVDAYIKAKPEHRGREIVVRHKPLKGAPPQPPLEQQIEEAYGVIGYSSNALLKAAMMGVPICATEFCAVSPLGVSTPDSLMLGPKYPERESILHNLAANQWTIDEIKSGRMWRDLQDRYEPEFLNLA